MAYRQVAKNYETPESKVQVKKQSSVYSKEFLEKQVDILLGIIVKNLPILGLTICEAVFATPQFKEILKDKLVEYYADMHQSCFQSMKSVIRSTMTKEDFPIKYETMKELVESLEREYGQSLPELGIEPQEVLLPYIKNQMIWYNNNFKFNEE